MDISECKNGLKVRISYNIDATHSRHDSCSDMRDMCGYVYEIDRYSTDRNYVIINGYTWDPGDLLTNISDEVKPNIFHFDEANL
jgi:hypothetical protein